MEEGHLIGAVSIKTAPQAELGQAWRESGDEYPDFCLLQSFTLLQCFPLSEPGRKPESKGIRLM